MAVNEFVKIDFVKSAISFDEIATCFSGSTNPSDHLIFFGLNREKVLHAGEWQPSKYAEFDDDFTYAFAVDSLMDGFKFLRDNFEQGIVLACNKKIPIKSRILNYLFYGERRSWWKRLFFSSDGIFPNLDKFHDSSMCATLPKVFIDVTNIFYTLYGVDFVTRIELKINEQK